MRSFVIGSIAALVALPAAAQVTPEQVWQNWQDAVSSGGSAFSGASVSRDGDALTISGATFEVDDGAGGTISIPIDPIVMTDNGDGSVDVTYPDTVTFTTPPAPTGDVLTMTISLPDAVTTASGSPDAVTYETAVPGTQFDIKVAGPQPADIVVAITNLVQTSTYTPDGDAFGIEGGFAADSLTLTGVITTDEGSAGTIDLSIADLATEVSGNLFDPGEEAELHAALQNGFAFALDMTHGAVALSIDTQEAAGPTKFTYTATGGTNAVGLSAEGMTYRVGTTGLAITGSGPEIPAPEVSVGLGEILIDLSGPVTPSPEPEDFTFVTRLVDMTVSDDLWALADPMGQFPRGPATLVIDTAGQVILTTPIFDEAAMAALGDAPPGQISALTLNALELAFVGASVDGTADLTFDNTDLVTFDGVPAPTGVVNLAATGVNGLIDRLVAVGVIPEDQAMEGRMMLSMFANAATDGTDSLTSDIEFRDKGIYINGQQIR